MAWWTFINHDRASDNMIFIDFTVSKMEDFSKVLLQLDF